MNVRILPLAAVVSLFLCLPANASTFSLRATIGGNNGAFPTGSYGFLVADTANDGFQFQSDTSLLTGVRSATENSFLGSDDVIFAINLILGDLGSGQNGFELDLRSFTTTAVNPAWDAGDNFALVWLQNGTSQTGDPFGFYRSDTVNTGNGSNIAFVTPGTTGTDQNLFDLAQGLSGGGTPVGNYTANNGTIAAIPEPATILLIGFAPILLRLLRSARARRA